MTSNCWPQFHVQSMIWATDTTGMQLLLDPPAGSGKKDNYGEANDPVGFAGCYAGWDSAVHAEIGATGVVRSQGHDVDVLMMAFHKSSAFIDECNSTANGDVLWNGAYYGSNVHPYETVFIKANRNIDPNLIGHLTEWHLHANVTSWDTCGSA